MFESLISGRSIYKIDSAPTDQFRKIFKAQVFKDAAMASKVNEIITGLSPINGDDDQSRASIVSTAAVSESVHESKFQRNSNDSTPTQRQSQVH